MTEETQDQTKRKKAHHLGLSTPEIQRARGAFLQGKEDPILTRIDEELDIQIAEIGADLDHTQNDLESFKEEKMYKFLEIPEAKDVKEALISMQNGLTVEQVSISEYYDDERTHNYGLPYNVDTVKKAVATLLAAGETNWLDQPFDARVDFDTPGPAIQTEKTTGRQVLKRLTLDLKYPQDIKIIHQIAVGIPKEDPYWENKKEENLPYTKREPEPLFPHGFPDKLNIFNNTDYGSNYGLTPETYIEAILFVRDIHSVAKEITGLEDPLYLKDRAKYNEDYIQHIAQGLGTPEKPSDLGRAFKLYTKNHDLNEVGALLSKMDSETGGIARGTNLTNNYFLSKIIQLPLEELGPMDFIMQLKTAYEKNIEQGKSKKEEPPI